MPAVNTCMGCHTRRSAAQKARDPEARRSTPTDEAPHSLGPHPQGAGVRALPARAPRQRRRDLPDLSRPGAEDGAGLSVRVAEHGVVRQLPRERLRSEGRPEGRRLRQRAPRRLRGRCPVRHTGHARGNLRSPRPARVWSPTRRRGRHRRVERRCHSVGGTPARALRLRDLSLLAARGSDRMSNHAGSTGVKRRDFLKVLGASGAAVATVGCTLREGREARFRTSSTRTRRSPGVSTYYATTCRECAAGCGVIAETRDGRVDQARGQSGASAQSRRALRARTVGAAGAVQSRSAIAARWCKRGTGRRSASTGTRRSRCSARGSARREAAAAPRTRCSSISTRAGSFPAFLDAWLAGFGMRPHLSVDFEADSAVDRGQPPRLRRGVAAPRLRGRAAHRLVRRRLPRRLGRCPCRSSSTSPMRARSSQGAPRFIYIGPRRSLTGLNADQWIACRPGTELAIANALARRGSTSPRRRTASGVAAATLTRLAAGARRGAAERSCSSGARGADALDVALAVARSIRRPATSARRSVPREAITAFDGVARSADAARRRRADARRRGAARCSCAA